MSHNRPSWVSEEPSKTGRSAVQGFGATRQNDAFCLKNRRYELTQLFYFYNWYNYCLIKYQHKKTSGVAKLKNNLLKQSFFSGLFVMICLNGCATVTESATTGVNDDFTAKTLPEGAKVVIKRLDKSKIKESFDCVTPCHIPLLSDHDYLVEITKNGYKKYTIKVKSEVSAVNTAGSSLGNAALGWGLGGGIFTFAAGDAIDAASGADYGLYPDNLDIQLIKDGSINRYKK